MNLRLIGVFYFSLLSWCIQAQEIQLVKGRYNVWLNEEWNENTSSIFKSGGYQYLKSKYPSLELKARFPKAEKPLKRTNELGIRLADLSLMFQINITESTENDVILFDLNKSKLFQVAEPHRSESLLFTPNDDSLSAQYALHRINAFAAWNVAQGDTNMVIGISDTGCELLHPDLKDNIKRNMNDPINGIDDDNDGFIDNYWGWDLGENDNDPSANSSFHGTFVAGLSSASTNNQTGVAGSGFKCKFVPIKITNSEGFLTEGYESIVYAADHGIKIINCSWGSNFYSAINQEIIRYATINKDALVLAGIGNQGTNNLFYPAYYEFVMAVGSTGPSDLKSYFSNFNYLVDLMAPGEQVMSTWIGDTYLVSNGTSLSTPITAGCAAIIRSSFPQLSALQTAEKIKVTADNIDGLTGNQAWVNQMGYGRLNMFNAITQNGKPSLALIEPIITDNKEDLFLPNDTVSITGIITNYLFQAQNVALTITSVKSNVEILTSNFDLGSFNTLQTLDFNSGIKLKLLENNILNDTAIIRLTFNSDGFIQHQYLVFKINADFAHLTKNNIKTTVSSRGLLGYGTRRPQLGYGFDFKETHQLLFEGGVMLGADNQQVFDVIRSENFQTKNDFEVFQRISKVMENEPDKQVLEGIYKTRTRAETPLAFDIWHRSYAFGTENDSNYVIFQFKITNTTATNANQVYFGVFADWDIGNFSRNRAGFQSSNKSIYAYSSDELLPFTSTSLLSNQAVNPYAFELSNTNDGINVADGFSDFEKWVAMNSTKLNAGTAGSGIDIATLLTADLGNLNAYETKEVAFVWAAGFSLEELNESIAAAQEKYNATVQPLAIASNQENKLKIYPNPTPNLLNISGIERSSTIKIYNTLGNILLKFDNKTGDETIDLSNLNVGLYLIEIANEKGTFFSKVVKN
jgi:hypothetical protein